MSTRFLKSVHWLSLVAIPVLVVVLAAWFPKRMKMEEEQEEHEQAAVECWVDGVRVPELGLSGSVMPEVTIPVKSSPFLHSKM